MKSFFAPLCFFLLALSCNADAETEKSDKLRVFVPILPYEYLLERIGGDWIEVSAIVPEGGDAHNYSPSPRQISEISKANLIFSGGITFESNFFVAVGDGINSPKDINLLEGLELLAGSCGECESSHAHAADGKGAEAADHDHDHDHHHDHGDLSDPHVWLSPRMLLKQAERVAVVLKQHAPAAASKDIDANLASLRADLTQLDKDLTEILAPMKGSGLTLRPTCLSVPTLISLSPDRDRSRHRPESPPFDCYRSILLTGVARHR